MLQLSKIKKITLLLLPIVILNGCSVNYTINIDEQGIKEKIEVLDNVSETRTVTDIMSNYKKKYPVYTIDELVDDTQLYQEIEGATYYKQTYDIDDLGYHLFYEFNYPLNQYTNANSINYSYDYKDITLNKNILTLKTTSPNNYLKYQDILTNITVNIITDYKVTNHNADTVIENRYIWNFDKTSNYQKRIDFTVDLSQQKNKQEPISNPNDKKNKITTIFITITAILIYIIIIISIIKRKSKA